MWYSAIGSRNRHTNPAVRAAITQDRIIAAASSGRAGEATTTPGRSRIAVIELSLWKCPPKPFW